ncbi:MAG TPA: hypothetical protein VM734_18000, partial [Kofleriaceae bacterium]|nr:hypothetical protein [Kofleriaceae bacterium]
MLIGEDELVHVRRVAAVVERLLHGLLDHPLVGPLLVVPAHAAERAPEPGHGAVDREPDPRV